MSDSLIQTANHIIDSGEYPGPQALNPTDGGFEEVADGIGVVRSFSHVWALSTEAGLSIFDTSLAAMGPNAVAALKAWRPEPVHHIVYTHGHIDHVGGAGAFLADAEANGHPAPRVVAHENVDPRFERYDLTNGYNTVINQRQFGVTQEFFSDWVRPDVTFETNHHLDLGGVDAELHHDRGETDDHCWVWIPERKTVLCGDLFMWVFPNAGNPQKVQRFAAEWAVALRRMVALEPELLLPAHGLPVEGRERVAMVLTNSATALEGLVRDTLEMMNGGARLDEILHTVRVPEELMALPYLRATYDEPEYVVRNLWRLYGGWYDGNPARLKPPADSALAAEVTALVGGVEALVNRAVALAVDDAPEADLRLACQLVEWAAQAAPTDAAALDARAEVYRRRRAGELSLMSKGIFGAAAKDSSRET